MDNEETEPAPEDLFGLPPALLQVMDELDADERISLQAYLEINNHLGDYPLHLVLSGLEEIRPGTTDEVMKEASTEATWDRQNRRIALFAEIAMKFLANLVAWIIALLGVVFSIKIFLQEPFSWGLVVKGVALLVFCIGGPVAAASFAGNSGVKVGSNPETDTSDT